MLCKATCGYGVFLALRLQKAQWRDSVTSLSDELNEALSKHLEAELDRSVGEALLSVEFAIGRFT